MSDFVEKKFRSLVQTIDDLKTYFDAKKNAADENKLRTTEVEFDTKSKSYILPEGMNEDQLISLLESNNIKTPISSSEANLTKEEIIMPKRTEGTIRKRKDGRWEGRYMQLNEQKSVYANSKIECITKLNNAIKDRDQTEIESEINRKMTLNTWFLKWIEVYKQPYLKPSSLENLITKYNKYLKNSIGKKRVSVITALDIQKVLNSITYEVSRKKIHILLKSCFNDIKRNKLVRENVVDYVDLKSTHTAKEKFIPSHFELKEFITQLKDVRLDLSFLCKFLSLTGLRTGEVLALNWKDIDKKSKTIKIDKAYDRIGKSITTPKTKTSVRRVVLLDEAQKALDDYMRAFGKTDPIFHSFTPTAVGNLLRFYGKRLGLPKMSMHSLRHYFATTCLEAGIERKLVSKWLGHANYSMTVDTYSHILDEYSSDQTTILANFVKATII